MAVIATKIDTPKLRKAVLENKKYISSKVIELEFKNIEPEEMHFAAGQFVNLMPAEGIFRSYSIVSDYKDTKNFLLAIDVSHEGVGANYVKKLNVGDVITFVGPSGRFILREPLADNLFFYATGTGIAPFIPMLWALSDIKYNGNVNVYFGVRNKEDLFYEELFKDFENKLSNIKVSFYLSGNAENLDFTNNSYRKGRITLSLGNGPITESQYYICGNSNMVNEVSSSLKTKGLSDEFIFTESF